MAMESRSCLGTVSMVLTLMLISIAFMSSSGLAQTVNDKPVPKAKANGTKNATKSPGDVYFQSLPKELKDYVKSCIKKISLECGEEIIGYLVKKTNVSDICCHYLVEMGFECHTAVVNVFAGSPDAEGVACKLTKNSRQVFDHCVAVEKQHAGQGHRPILP